MNKKMKSIWIIPSAFDLFKVSNRLVKQQKPEKPSESHSRDRYEVANQIMADFKSKTAIIAIAAVMMLSSCATQKPRSNSLHRSMLAFQEAQQTESCVSSGKDPLRVYRNWDRRPKKMTRIPFTNWYIF